MPAASPNTMNCDRIASHYETLERLSFGRCLERARLAFLDDARSAQHALLCGAGDGRFLARLLRANLAVSVDFVDLSAEMTRLARHRVAGMGPAFARRVQFHHGDIREIAPRLASPRGEQRYDLIVTHFFLDCFSDSDLRGVTRLLAAASAPGSRWIVSEFRESRSPLTRLWTRALIRALYFAFRVTTGLRVTRLPDYLAALSAAGYTLRAEQPSLLGLLHSSLWEALPEQSISAA
jgi:ubiquinone/menaquinone biosynthesis C-methylase UbiE